MKNPNIMQAHGDDRAARQKASALAEFYKAFKAITFYPEDHPLREEILRRAFQAVTHLMEGGRLTMVATRTGLVVEEPEGGIEDTRMVKSLGRELFAREIQRLTLMREMSADQFSRFLSLLAMEPQKIISDGGMAGILEQHGIETVIANEIDIAAVFTKRKFEESPEEPAPEMGASEKTDDGAVEKSEGEAPPDGSPSERLENLTVMEIVSLMEDEDDDERYAALARLLTVKADVLKAEGDFDTLFPVLLSLLNQNADAGRSPFRRETSLRTLRETARGEMTDHLLDHLEDEEYRQKEIIYHILGHLEEDLVGELVRRTGESESEQTRTSLTTAILRMGNSAVRPLLALLNDGDRRKARVAVTVLGEMGNREAVKGLTMTAYHADNRIRFETIRSLAMIGGKDALDVLLDLFGDANRAIRRHVILWLGITRNEKALQPLLDLLAQRDLFGRSLTLKKEAVLAVGRIGDRRALPTLIRLARKHRLIAPSRWEPLRMLAIETIGRLGGEEARDFLEKTASRGGRMGRACTAALDTLDNHNGE